MTMQNIIFHQGTPQLLIPQFPYLDLIKHTRGVHPRRNIDCIAPYIVLGLSTADDTRHHWADVNTCKGNTSCTIITSLNSKLGD